MRRVQAYTLLIFTVLFLLVMITMTGCGEFPRDSRHEVVHTVEVGSLVDQIKDACKASYPNSKLDQDKCVSDTLAGFLTNIPKGK